MREERPSLTAEAVAMLRAASDVDTHAEHLLTSRGRRVLSAWRAARRLRLPLDPLTMGIEPAIAARHTFIDAAVVAGLHAGARQLVLLGAGYDARPWRLSEALGGSRVFLVDHPATAGRRARVTGRLPPLPPDVHAVRVDVRFDREDFGERLLSAGLDRRAPAVFVWEGVSMYLTPEVVQGCLRRMAELSAPGSTLAMDFWGGRGQGAASRASELLGGAVVGLVGEPLRSRADAETARAWLDAAGWAVAELVDAETAATRIGRRGALRGMLFAHARRVSPVTQGR